MIPEIEASLIAPIIVTLTLYLIASTSKKFNIYFIGDGLLPLSANFAAVFVPRDWEN